jgi:hypothetical protein
MALLRCLFLNGLGGLEVAYWPLEPKFAGSNPAEAVVFFRAKKILSTPFFGRVVKLWVPCRRFTARKRSPECYVEVEHLQDKFTGHFSPTYFYIWLVRISRRRLVTKV